MSYACKNKLTIYEGTSVTSDVDVYVAAPENVQDYYLLLDVTKNSGTSFDSSLSTTESSAGSTSGGQIHSFGTVGGTTMQRIDPASVSGFPEMGPYLRFSTSSLSGNFDIKVELWYSRGK